MKCEEIRKLISAFIDGELSSREQEIVSSHLKECTQCSRYKDDMNIMLRSLKILGCEKASSDITSRVREAMFDRLSGTERQRSENNPGIFPFLLKAAAVVIILAGTFFVIYRHLPEKEYNSKYLAAKRSHPERAGPTADKKVKEEMGSAKQKNLAMQEEKKSGLSKVPRVSAVAKPGPDAEKMVKKRSARKAEAVDAAREAEESSEKKADVVSDAEERRIVFRLPLEYRRDADQYIARFLVQAEAEQDVVLRDKAVEGSGSGSPAGIKKQPGEPVARMRSKAESRETEPNGVSQEPDNVKIVRVSDKRLQEFAAELEKEFKAEKTTSVPSGGPSSHTMEKENRHEDKGAAPSSTDKYEPKKEFFYIIIVVETAGERKKQDSGL